MVLGTWYMVPSGLVHGTWYLDGTWYVVQGNEYNYAQHRALLHGIRVA